MTILHQIFKCINVCVRISISSRINKGVYMNKFVKALVSVFLVLFISCSAIAVTTEEVKQNIISQSKAMGVDPAIMLSIAKAESGFNQNARAGNNVGVFQLSVYTAKNMGINPYDLDDNIKGGIAYYKKMYKMFGSTELALAAYNAGPGNVKKYNGVPPFTETRRFISKIMSNYNKLKLNPDPAIASYKDAFIDINDETTVSEEDFRMQQDAILKSYLSSQGI